MAGTSTDVDGYLAGVAGGARAALEQLRRTIRAVAPEAAESISYGMPTVKYRGCPLVYFAAWKKHCALYALDFSAHSNELAAFDISGGTLRFAPSRPPSAAPVQELLRARIAAIDAAGGGSGPKVERRAGDRRTR